MNAKEILMKTKELLMKTMELSMKIKLLKLLCGNDEPLPTYSVMRLLLIGCAFVFSSYAQADSLIVVENFAFSSSAGSPVLLGFGLCSLLIVRRRKPWIAVVNQTNLTHG